MNFFGTKEIKTHVNRWVRDHAESLKDKVVVDFPAGNGVSSRSLKDVGAQVKPFDLLPDLFNVDGLVCEFADLAQSSPLKNASVDFVLCQEGIEHVADQGFVFREFSRALKVGGRLVVTTPNYSNLKSRLSYLFCESEYFGKLMPPNEIDRLWLTSKNQDAIYYGHVFLVGFFKLRLWAELAGFKITRIHSTRVNTTSLLMFPVLYPFIFFFNWKSYRRALRKNKPNPLWKELFRHSVDPRILLENHLFIEFEKIKEPAAKLAELRLNTQTAEYVT